MRCHIKVPVNIKKATTEYRGGMEAGVSTGPHAVGYVDVSISQQMTGIQVNNAMPTNHKDARAFKPKKKFNQWHPGNKFNTKTITRSPLHVQLPQDT